VLKANEGDPIERIRQISFLPQRFSDQAADAHELAIVTGIGSELQTQTGHPKPPPDVALLANRSLSHVTQQACTLSRRP
jgi:hypothetical protein